MAIELHDKPYNFLCSSDAIEAVASFDKISSLCYNYLIMFHNSDNYRVIVAEPSTGRQVGYLVEIL